MQFMGWSLPSQRRSSAPSGSSTATPQVIRPVELGTAGMPPYTRRLLQCSFAIGVIPPIVLITALSTRSLYLLDYVHVITGGTWTGFDVFMGVVMSRIMRSLEIQQRVEVAKRLTPTTFFILPSLAAVAITSRIYLAES